MKSQRHRPVGALPGPGSSGGGPQFQEGGTSNEQRQEQVSGVDFSSVATPFLDSVPDRAEKRTSCIWMSPGDSDAGGRVRYVPLMSKVGDPFIDACIDALDALVFGPGARDLFEQNPEEVPVATDIADIDLNIFKDARATSAVASPKRVHATATSSSGVADAPAWRRKAAENQLAIHGNSVRDYLGADESLGLEDGKFLSREIVICHARFNAGGGSQWMGGTLYWSPTDGYRATSGPDEGKVSAPFITLGHELTHGWIDHFTSMSENLGKRYTDQADFDIGENTNSDGVIDYATLRGLWDPDGTSPYSDAEFEAMVHAHLAYGGTVDAAESDELIAPPLDLDNPLYADTRQVGYNEEEANTDLDYRTAARARAWAEQHNPDVVGEGGALSDLGNRSEYNEWEQVTVEGPLSARPAR